MRIILFSSQPYDRDSFSSALLPAGCELVFQHAHLGLDTAALASGCEVLTTLSASTGMRCDA